MSQTIWTQCGDKRNLRPLNVRVWRVVEAQHKLATSGLVDNQRDQELLENLIESVKPPKYTHRENPYADFLLHSPFRYQPYGHGSRFGHVTELGIFYGAENVNTALAEKAYHMLLLLEGTEAAIPQVQKTYTAFPATIETSRGVDLCAEPFLSHTTKISSPVSYADSQPLGTEMRNDGVKAFRYQSARDPDKGANVGVFCTSAFTRDSPQMSEQVTWECVSTKNNVNFTRKQLALHASRLDFPRDVFLINGLLPQP